MSAREVQGETEWATREGGMVRPHERNGERRHEGKGEIEGGP